MKIYNSLSGELEDLKTIAEQDGKTGDEAKELKMYVCGPTVYDRGHIGHGRSAVAFDVIRKYLEYKGYNVKYVMNITDIDDKMIKRADERGISVSELTKEVEPMYLDDYRALGIRDADEYPHATQYIEAMVEMIKKLEADGHTYVLDDGVYYDVTTFKDYGKLSGQNLDELQAGARVDVKDAKKNPQDFVLWKLAKDNEPYDDYWDSPWGEGRPGWHIECSAMTWKTLGDKFDIHGGGLDLKFPHHECEIAQTEGALGAGTFAKYWMHNGFINIDNEKMSKSLDNFFTLEEVFAKYHPQVIRMFYLGTHYRSPINYSLESLNHVRAALGRLHDFVRNLRAGYEDLPDGEATVGLDDLQKFEEFMDNDFNVSGALGVLFELVKNMNSLRAEGKLNKSDIDNVEELLKKMDQVFGVIFSPEEQTIDEDIEKLIREREEARKNKDFAKADKIRDDLAAEGIVLEDTPKGVLWKREL